MRVLVYCIYRRTDSGGGAEIALQENERVVSVDHRGADWWIYIERHLDVREEQ